MKTAPARRGRARPTPPTPSLFRRSCPHGSREAGRSPRARARTSDLFVVLYEKADVHSMGVGQSDTHRGRGGSAAFDIERWFSRAVRRGAPPLASSAAERQCIAGMKKGPGRAPLPSRSLQAVYSPHAIRYHSVLAPPTLVAVVHARYTGSFFPQLLLSSIFFSVAGFGQTFEPVTTPCMSSSVCPRHQ